MDQQEVAYLSGRAAAEFQAAQQAKSLLVARPHYRMAVQYLDRAEELDRRLRSRGSVSNGSEMTS
jgi:hypothetical protein